MTSVKTRLPSRKVLPYSDQLIYEANVVNCNCFYSSIKPTQIDNIWYAHFWTTPHRAKNKRFLTLRCTKTGSIQPKLSAACFVVQSCLADADFVVFSNYCLIGTRGIVRSFRFQENHFTFRVKHLVFERPSSTTMWSAEHTPSEL